MTETKKNHRRQDILLYEQNLLEGDERRELEEHMRDCPECQATLVEVKRFLPRLHEALKPKELPAEELLRRVKAQMETKDAKVAFFLAPAGAVGGPCRRGGVAAAAAIAVRGASCLRWSRQWWRSRRMPARGPAWWRRRGDRREQTQETKRTQEQARTRERGKPPRPSLSRRLAATEEEPRPLTGVPGLPSRATCPSTTDRHTWSLSAASIS